MNKGQITILLADDHTIVRQGLAKIIDTESDFKVIGEATNGREAVRLVEKLKPDAVIMDIGMPQLNGVEATRQIKKSHPEIKIIILSMHSNERFISELLSLGASGYLLKDSSGSDIIKAIEAAINGKTYLSPTISHHVVEDYLSLKGKSTQEDLYSQLTNREREVFQLIAEGRSVKEIADLLCISPNTAKNHRTNIMEKLKMDNISQLIQYAIRLGLVEIQS